MVTSLIKGEALFAFGYFVMDALEPLPCPEGWGKKKWFALGQYAMIAGTLEGTVSAVFLYVMRDTGPFILAASLATASLIGSYAIKNYSLCLSIEEDTANLDKIETGYEKQVQILKETVSKLKGQIEELQKLEKIKEQHYTERQKELTRLTEELNLARIQVGALQKSIETLKGIPTELGNRIEQLAGKIDDFASKRKELNQDLYQTIEKEKSDIQQTNKKLSDSISKLDKENQETSENLTLLGKLIDSLDSVVHSILSLYEEVEKSMAKLNEEFKTWQVDKLIEILKKEGAEIGATADQIGKVTEAAKAEIEKSNKNKAELEKILAKNRQTLQAMVVL